MIIKACLFVHRSGKINSIAAIPSDSSVGVISCIEVLEEGKKCTFPRKKWIFLSQGFGHTFSSHSVLFHQPSTLSNTCNGCVSGSGTGCPASHWLQEAEHTSALWGCYSNREMMFRLLSVCFMISCYKICPVHPETKCIHAHQHLT